MGDDPILKQLQYILELLNNALDKMDDVSRPKGRNIIWRLFFPAGEFMGRKAIAKEVSVIMLDIHNRLQDMENTLFERKHPLAQTIKELNYLDLMDMSNRLVELPERSQYMIVQVDELRIKVENAIEEIKLGSR